MSDGVDDNSWSKMMRCPHVWSGHLFMVTAPQLWASLNYERGSRVSRANSLLAYIFFYLQIVKKTITIENESVQANAAEL